MAAVSKYVSDFEISLLVLNCSGSLVGVKRSGLVKETGFKTVCPECEQPTPMKQQYRCENGHVCLPGAVRKAKEISKGELQFVRAEEIKAAKESELPLNVLDLTVHSASDVDHFTYPSDSAYVFYPKAPNQAYAVLLDLVSDPSLAFVGFCNLRNSEKLLRLHRWEDNLVVQTLWTPDELNERDSNDLDDVAADPKFKKILDFVRSDVEDFEPESYKNRRRERLMEVVGSGDVIRTRPAQKEDKDLLGSLLAALEAKGA